MYILDHAVAPLFLEVISRPKRVFYFLLLPQYLPWHPAPPGKDTTINKTAPLICLSQILKTVRI